MNRPAKSASLPRVLAHQALLRVEQDKAYADRVLDTLLSRHTLEPRDRALVTELVYGTLRHVALLDFHWRSLVHRGRQRVSPATRAALRLGVHQLLFMRVPAHSAVHESVSLLESPRERGFANALLRELGRRLEAGTLTDPTAVCSDPLEALAVSTNHPRWLLEQLAQSWSLEELSAFAQANNATPPVQVRVRPGCEHALRDAWLAHGLDAHPPAHAGVRAALPNALEVRGGGSVRDWPGFDEGWFVVQDVAAQLVCALAAAQPGDVVLDLCAAPGGKTAALADAVGSTGHVLAVDLHAGRVRLVDALVGRLGLTNVSTALLDARHVSEVAVHLRQTAGRERADLVVVDAPCSGLGTLRRHPELATRDQASLRDLVTLQSDVLRSAAQLVAPGGRIVYSVCTVTEEEGAAQVAAFLREHQGFVLEAPRSEALGSFLETSPHVAAPGLFRTWPHRHGSDGFVGACSRAPS